MEYLFFAPIILFLYVTNAHLTVGNLIMTKYNKFRQLNSLVASQYTNIFYILWVSICIVCKAMYIQMLQYLNKSVQKIDKNTYRITYTINGNIYYINVKTKKGPKSVIQVLDENDNDITDLIHSYMGPSDNFHNSLFTPEFFGKEKLTLSLGSGMDVTFEKNNVIKI